MTTRTALAALVFAALAACQDLGDSDESSPGTSQDDDVVPGEPSNTAGTRATAGSQATAGRGNGPRRPGSATPPPSFPEPEPNGDAGDEEPGVGEEPGSADPEPGVDGPVDPAREPPDSPESPGPSMPVGGDAGADPGAGGSVGGASGSWGLGGTMNMGGTMNAGGTMNMGGTMNTGGTVASGGTAGKIARGGTTGAGGKPAAPSGGTMNVAGKANSAGKPSASAGAAAGGKPSSGTAGAPGACNAVVTQYGVTGAEHIPTCSPVSYETNPPCEGNHYDDAIAFGTYDYPVPDGYVVHSLEHGGIAVWYNCPGGCPDEVARATEWIEDLPEDVLCRPDGVPRRMLLIPDPDLPTRWGASAWGFTLTASCFDERAFNSFYKAHYGKGTELYCRGTSVGPKACPKLK